MKEQRLLFLSSSSSSLLCSYMYTKQSEIVIQIFPCILLPFAHYTTSRHHRVSSSSSMCMIQRNIKKISSFNLSMKKKIYKFSVWRCAAIVKKNTDFFSSFLLTTFLSFTRSYTAIILRTFELSRVFNLLVVLIRSFFSCVFLKEK